jgi:putative chitinase
MIPKILLALGIDSKWEEPLELAFKKYDINNSKRQAAFIGQCAHESNNFNELEENLNYSSKQLMKVWPAKFSNLTIADKYAFRPKKIANKVYGDRMGNYQENDGWNFRGRGLIQITGRTNYTLFSDEANIDCIEYPDLLIETDNACMSAAWFWDKNGLNQLADISDIVGITQRINGGMHGIDDRNDKTNRVLQLLA